MTEPHRSSGFYVVLLIALVSLASNVAQAWERRTVSEAYRGFREAVPDLSIHQLKKGIGPDGVGNSFVYKLDARYRHEVKNRREAQLVITGNQDRLIDAEWIRDTILPTARERLKILLADLHLVDMTLHPRHTLKGPDYTYLMQLHDDFFELAEMYHKAYLEERQASDLNQENTGPKEGK
ncbi:hypothetical protein JYT83_00455 [bacterium AH-315-F18]|nr:hypothetical protein [bacterium AH-315-F18]